MPGPLCLFPLPRLLRIGTHLLAQPSRYLPTWLALSGLSCRAVGGIYHTGRRGSLNSCLECIFRAPKVTLCCKVCRMHARAQKIVNYTLEGTPSKSNRALFRFVWSPPPVVAREAKPPNFSSDLCNLVPSSTSRLRRPRDATSLRLSFVPMVPKGLTATRNVIGFANVVYVCSAPLAATGLVAASGPPLTSRPFLCCQKCLASQFSESGHARLMVLGYSTDTLQRRRTEAGDRRLSLLPA